MDVPLYLSQESIEPLPALVVLGVEPDDPDSVQETRDEGGDVLGLRIHQLLARLAQQGDELQAVFSFLVALLLRAIRMDRITKPPWDPVKMI